MHLLHLHIYSNLHVTYKNGNSEANTFHVFTCKERHETHETKLTTKQVWSYFLQQAELLWYVWVTLWKTEKITIIFNFGNIWNTVLLTVTLCTDFTCHFPSIKTYSMPMFFASGDDNMRIMLILIFFSKIVTTLNHWFDDLNSSLFPSVYLLFLHHKFHFSLLRKSINPWWNSLGLSM